MLFRMLTLTYFVGLFVVSISIGSLHIAEYGFLVMGGGCISYSIIMGIVSYLHKGG